MMDTITERGNLCLVRFLDHCHVHISDFGFRLMFRLDVLVYINCKVHCKADAYFRSSALFTFSL